MTSLRRTTRVYIANACTPPARLPRADFLTFRQVGRALDKQGDGIHVRAAPRAQAGTALNTKLRSVSRSSRITDRDRLRGGQSTCMAVCGRSPNSPTLRSRNSAGGRPLVMFYSLASFVVVVAPSLVGSIARPIHEELVAGVDQSVEQRCGDDVVGEQRISVHR
jgi:hypothetical protein